MSDDFQTSDSVLPAVGLIGIGLLGTALAERLMGGGFRVCGYDTDSDSRERLAALGGMPVGSIEDVPRTANRILLCLPNSQVVKSVVAQLADELSSGSCLIDTTTGDPEVTRQLASDLSARDISLVDACVLGSSQLTREGRAQLLVGGTDSAITATQDVLTAISPTLHRIGETGSGQLMKLVANLIMGLNRAALAEGLSFAQASGLDTGRVLEVLKAGLAYSRVMDAKGERMIEQNFAPQARLSQHLKDVNLMRQQAQSVGLGLPLSDTHAALLRKVEKAGGGDLDNSAIIRAWQ